MSDYVSIKREPIPHDKTGGATRQDDPFGFDWGNMDFGQGRFGDDLRDALGRIGREGTTDYWAQFVQAVSYAFLVKSINDAFGNPIGKGAGVVEAAVNHCIKNGGMLGGCLMTAMSSPNKASISLLETLSQLINQQPGTGLVRKGSLEKLFDL